jgi:hypothetical protein
MELLSDGEAMAFEEFVIRIRTSVIILQDFNAPVDTQIRVLESTGSLLRDILDFLGRLTSRTESKHPLVVIGEAQRQVQRALDFIVTTSEQMALLTSDSSVSLSTRALAAAASEVEHVAYLLGLPQRSVETHPLSVTVDTGSASAEEIADILSDLSVLYRRMGGSGIDFTPQGVHILAGGEE